MKNTNEDLRNLLFAQLQNITDPEEGADMDKAIEVAKTAADIAKVIVSSAKVELDYHRFKAKLEFDGVSAFLEPKTLKLNP